MNKLIITCFILFTVLFAYSEDKIAVRLSELGITKYDLKKNPNKEIKMIYAFNENGIKGALIIIPLNDPVMEVLATLIQTNDGYVLKKIEPLKDNFIPSVEMKIIIISALSKLNGSKYDNISDAATSATKHAKKLYIYIKYVIGRAIIILDDKK